MQLRTQIISLGLAICLLFAQVSTSLAQDKGTPAMQTVALFSLGGGAAGGALGIAIFMLDPLSDSANVVNSVLQGVAVGAIAGTILGAMQLQRQMVLPYQGPSGLPPGNEFQGDVQRFELERFQSSGPRMAKASPNLGLVNYQLNF